MAKPKANNRHFGRDNDKKMVELMDELEAFSDFQETILPVLRKAIQANMSAEEIYSKFQAHAAARAVSIAMKEVDSTKALSAIRDILDRSGGKAAEKREVTHKIESLPDDQLNALLLSKLSNSESTEQPDPAPEKKPNPETLN